MNEFHIGDWVEIIMKDGAPFRGVLMDFTDQYIILNGCGFPLDDITAMYKEHP